MKLITIYIILWSVYSGNANANDCCLTYILKYLVFILINVLLLIILALMPVYLHITYLEIIIRFNNVISYIINS